MGCDSQSPQQEDIEPQYRFDVESNVLWVDTIYWKFQADMEQMDLLHIFKSKSVKFPFFPHRFHLEIKKISPSKFLVGLVREASHKVPEGGYFFQVSYTLVASPCPRKLTHMKCDDENALVHFTLEEFRCLYGVNDVWLIKCVVWLYEYSYFDTERMREQERLWQSKLKKAEAGPSQYEQMAFVLGRQTLKNLFTGQMDYKFVDYKSSLLMRSFRYSDKLLSRIGRSQNQLGSAESIEDLGRLLGYIRYGRERWISNKDCILLYASAFYCGLSYLKLQCSDYIKMNLMNVDFFIDVLIVSDMVNDQDLMDHALEWFSKNKKKVLNSVQWKNFRNRNHEMARGFRLLFLKCEVNEREVLFEHLNSFIRIPT